MRYFSYSKHFPWVFLFCIGETWYYSKNAASRIYAPLWFPPNWWFVFTKWKEARTTPASPTDKEEV